MQHNHMFWRLEQVVTLLPRLCNQIPRLMVAVAIFKVERPWRLILRLDLLVPASKSLDRMRRRTSPSGMCMCSMW